MAKRDSAAIERDVRAAAARCGVADVLDKKPKKLTEEQRRRVDLARALVRRPGAYLIQPPSGKNAEEGRAWMRRQIVQLHREQDATIIYATEDKAEALQLADRIVLMDAGTVRQVGTPAALLNKPANLFVAKYFGAPPMNLLAAVLTATGAAGVTVRLSGGETLTLPLALGVGLVGEHVTLGVRANHVALAVPAESGAALIEARLERVDQKRGKTRLRTRTEAGLLRAVVPGEVAAKPGDIVTLALPLARCHLFDDAGEAFKPRPGA
jgi:multiple sugar transport system ATP-binding protein